MTYSIIVRFALTKGEGELPSDDLMTEKEKKTPESMCYFLLDWDADAAGESLQEEDDGDFIVDYEIIYKGLARFDEEYQSGIKVFDGEVRGYPEPVVKFKLSKKVDSDDFLSGIWGSCVRLRSIAQEKNDEDGFFYEDHNGYSSVWDGEEAEEFIKELKADGLYCGKVIKRENFEEEVSLDIK